MKTRAADATLAAATIAIVTAIWAAVWAIATSVPLWAFAFGGTSAAIAAAALILATPRTSHATLAPSPPQHPKDQP